MHTTPPQHPPVQPLPRPAIPAPKVSDHVVIHYSRRLAKVGRGLAEELVGRNGVVMQTILTKEGAKGAIVLISGPLAPQLRELGRNGLPLPDRHPHSRDIFLFIDEFETTGPKFAPFHRQEFNDYLRSLVAGHELLHNCVNVTREMRRAAVRNRKKFFEHVYRVHIWRTAVSILIYSSVDTRTRWTKGRGLDGIRFVYEVPWQGAVWHQVLDRKLNRVGDPFARLDVILEDLSRPGRLVPGSGAGWSREPPF